MGSISCGRGRMAVGIIFYSIFILFLILHFFLV